jgi:hypothetical protein
MDVCLCVFCVRSGAGTKRLPSFATSKVLRLRLCVHSCMRVCA